MPTPLPSLMDPSCTSNTVASPGRYPAVIIDSEMKPIRAGTGRYLQLAFEITDGPYTGHVIFLRLCIEHVSAFTARLARQQLASIAAAVGVLAPKDSGELHDRPVLIEVGCEKKTDGRIANTVVGVFAAITAGIDHDRID